MIKPEQVPNEVWMAMQSVIGDHVSVATQKDAIAAAINAWPGMEIEMVFVEEDYLILPVPKDS